MKSDTFCMILTTAGNQQEASRLAEILVSQRLAACVQMMEINSVYSWQEKINRDNEILLLIKSKTDLYTSIKAAILENHSYEVPEIIQIPFTQGLPTYLHWIEENTK